MDKEIAYGTGLLAWLIQRITGLLLVIYLFIHVWWVHFPGVKTPFDFLINTLFLPDRMAILILLVLVIPHALNGFRVFVIDFGISERTQRILFWVLTGFGIIIIIWSYYIRFYT
jgi:succinate dehydrogenase / fumarate reductase cytochrome b subunit